MLRFKKDMKKLFLLIVLQTTINGSTRRGGASRRSRFSASSGGPCERTAMRTPFLSVPTPGNDHRFSATRTLNITGNDFLCSYIPVLSVCTLTVKLLEGKF